MSQKHQVIYAFIDSQNLNLGTKNERYNRSGKQVYKGWQIDYAKFRRYLQDKFRVSRALLFIGYIKENEGLYRSLKSYGYELIFKPTTKDNLGKPKGNIDAELVLSAAAILYTKYDKAVIVSGDGDFYCLHQYLVEKKKLLKLIIPDRLSESSLLKEFQSYKIFIESERSKLEYKK